MAWTKPINHPRFHEDTDPPPPAIWPDAITLCVVSPLIGAPLAAFPLYTEAKAWAEARIWALRSNKHGVLIRWEDEDTFKATAYSSHYEWVSTGATVSAGYMTSITARAYMRTEWMPLFEIHTIPLREVLWIARDRWPLTIPSPS